MNDQITTLNELKKLLAQFVEERDWQQYHTPKSLSMSIAIEAAELMEHFQWCGNRESIKELEEHRQEVAFELVDVLSNVLNLASRYNIDLAQTLEQKMEQTRNRYPVELVKGSRQKYLEQKKRTRQEKA